jgi:hypothetical protein
MIYGVNVGKYSIDYYEGIYYEGLLDELYSGWFNG